MPVKVTTLFVERKKNEKASDVRRQPEADHEKLVAVTILRQQQGIYTLRCEEDQLQTDIDETLIRENGLTIDLYKQCVWVPERLCRAWFATARQREQERVWQVFREHVPLFWRYREQILTNPRLFWTPTPFTVGSAYVAFAYSGPYPLGIVVQAWSQDSTYQRRCPKCSGMGLIYTFGGSILSGSVRYGVVCTDCGHQWSYSDCNFRGLLWPLRGLAEKYDGQERDDAYSLDEAITVL